MPPNVTSSLRQYELFIRKRLSTGHFVVYMTQIDIKNETFVNAC